MVPLRLGLIGCGWAGSLRSAAIAGLPGVRLAGIADLDPERARAMAQQSGAAAAQDWRALISRDDLNAIIVSTPPSLHAEMCIAALDSGKHVLCEKPLARTPAECGLILEAARRNDRILATGFN